MRVKIGIFGTFSRPSTVDTIFEGASEIQQLVIARAIAGMRIE